MSLAVSMTIIQCDPGLIDCFYLSSCSVSQLSTATLIPCSVSPWLRA